MGRRISKTINGTTWFLWDNGQLLAEYDTAGNRTKRYAYLPGQSLPTQVQDANGIYTVHGDHLNTPRLLTDSNQTVVWQSTQQAFGASQPNEDADTNGTSIIFNLRFPGQYYDNESGLHYKLLSVL